MRRTGQAAEAAAVLGWSRRQLLRLGGAGLAAVSAASCDVLSTEPESGTGGGRAGSSTSDSARSPQAPDLAMRVKAGKLPPLDKRLPNDPPVVQPVSKEGVYGGEWRSALSGPDDDWHMQATIGYEHLAVWRRDWKGKPGTSEVEPGVAQHFEADDRGIEYTFTLRNGLRWSDGHPCTADDFVFAQNDVLNNTDIYPVQDNNPTAHKVDRYAVRFVFDEPDALFLERQATETGLILASKPRHYLTKFHKKYNPDVDQLAKTAGEDTWSDLLLAKADLWRNPELPTLCGWQVTEPLGKGNRVVAQRNPYYWKVDPQGRQLPYIDRVVYTMAAKPQVRLLRTMRGDQSLVVRSINTPQNKPVLARNRDKGAYHFFDTVKDNMNEAILMLNLTHDDPAKRKLFQSKDLRVGLSYAINRKEIIDSIYQRQGKPWQVAPRPEDVLYDEQMATQHLAYDLDRASAHLDRVAKERNGEGVRVTADGTPVRFTLDFPITSERPEYPDLLELVSGYWKKVGVDVRMNPQSMDVTGQV